MSFQVEHIVLLLECLKGELVVSSLCGEQSCIELTA